MSADCSSSGKPVISIIVPVFNVEPYLLEGLDSLFAQNFTHCYEVILVDDCSTDDSLAICREFAVNHPHRFQLIESAANGGVSVARNIGLNNASGDYFMFADPDDTLPEGALRSLYTAATLHDADIVKGNNTIFNERGESDARYNVSTESMITGESVLTTLYNHSRVRGHPWGKLFNRSRLGHIQFPVGARMAEDLYYCGEVFSAAKSLLLINEPVYRYRNRETGSTGRKFETGAYLDWLDSVEKIGRFARNRQQTYAHRSLQVRTMTQFARECRNLPPDIGKQVLTTIEEKCNAWNIRPIDMIMGGGTGLRTLARYLKLRLALRQIRRKLARS